MDSYFVKVKYFLRQLSPSYLFTPNHKLSSILEIIQSPSDYARDEVEHAEEVSEAFFHPEYLSWCFENDKEPMQWAGYSYGFRYFEYVPVNLWIAYAILMLPQVPLVKLTKPVRGVIYNMINRMYCITFDYQHRNPTPDELLDYGEMTFPQRIMKSYKDGEDNDVWPLGLRYLADVACVFGMSYVIYKAADTIAHRAKWVPRSLLAKMTADISRRLLPPVATVTVAHAFDIFFARWSEISIGAPIYRKNGEQIIDEKGGKALSRKAGTAAVRQTFEQRCLTVICCLSTGSIMTTLLTHTIGMPRNAILNAAIHIVFLGLGLTAGVPLSLALYDKKIYFKSTDLENDFHRFVDANGNAEELYVYRGD